jgi:hypothetical protein
MNKIISLIGIGITFMFITSYAENITDALPKEFFDNAELYSKLDMIENLSVLEKVSDQDLQLLSQKNNENPGGNP